MSEPRVGVYMLDVGQGDCTFVVGPSGDAAPVLFDCRDRYVAERFVKDHGIDRLSAAVVSHLDQDHIRGLLPFLRSFRSQHGPRSVEAFYVNVDRKPDPELRRAAYVLLERVIEWDRQGEVPLFGSFREGTTKRVCAGEGWSVDIVLPRLAELYQMRLEGGEQPNRTSAVLRVAVNNHAILIGGDATLDSWERLGHLERELLRAEVFRIPHHGGNIDEGGTTWTIATLYERVAPRVAIISVGTNNDYKHPERVQLPTAPVNGGDCRILCTQLTPRCHDDPQTQRARALKNPSPVVYPYRHRVFPGDPKRSRPTGEVSCAGSMVAWIDPSGITIQPDASGWHDNFVELLDHPLCRRPPPPPHAKILLSDDDL